MLTFDKDVADKLKENDARLMEEIKTNNTVLYKFLYEEPLYLMFGKNDSIFIDNKLSL